MSDLGIQPKDGVVVASLVTAMGTAVKAFLHNKNTVKRIDDLETTQKETNIKLNDLSNQVSGLDGYIRGKMGD